MRRVYDQDGGSREIVAPNVERILDRVDALTDDLRAGLRTFDTDAAAARWATVKVGLRLMLALALLTRGRGREDE